MSQRIALYGGSFDPIHHGHLIVARSVAEQLDIDRVILLPSRTPPHKLNDVLADGSHREAMVRTAVDGDPLFDVSTHDLTCDGPSYTAHTVRHFRETLPANTELLWIVGADSLLELHTWYQPEEIVRACRVVTARRPGSAVPDLPDLRSQLGADVVDKLLADVVPTPHVDISSTNIRQRVARSQPIRYLVPEAVENFIQAHALYQGKT